MSGAPIHTWRDLLLPNEQDTHVILEVTEGHNTAKTSSFSLPAWDPERLPPSAHLFENLPSRMHEHLRVIIDQHFSDQAARTSFTNRRGRSVTPNDVIEAYETVATSAGLSTSVMKEGQQPLRNPSLSRQSRLFSPNRKLSGCSTPRTFK
ncbi:hypothetical protein BGY98DRAFT_150141 [Russula aff. rugulosa BPL654]|nr:hypothetical protein BGY98DRAFT_150141 [Russula aff. rugulosa BPL654]